jgi:hypothetical protein
MNASSSVSLIPRKSRICKGNDVDHVFLQQSLVLDHTVPWGYTVNWKCYTKVLQNVCGQL